MAAATTTTNNLVSLQHSKKIVVSVSAWAKFGGSLEFVFQRLDYGNRLDRCDECECVGEETRRKRSVEYALRLEFVPQMFRIDMFAQ
jgi:hypothetical protein